MKKEMLVNVLQNEECRIAILENGTLEELYVERTNQESYVGNIYKGRIVNIDATLICEEPRIGPLRAEMERILAETTSARVSVKATTNEGMGWIGRGEGIACIAVASVDSD